MTQSNLFAAPRNASREIRAEVLHDPAPPRDDEAAAAKMQRVASYLYNRAHAERGNLRRWLAIMDAALIADVMALAIASPGHQPRSAAYRALWPYAEHWTCLDCFTEYDRSTPMHLTLDGSPVCPTCRKVGAK